MSNTNLAIVKDLRSDLDIMVVSLVEQFLKENKTKSTANIYKRHIEEFFGVDIDFLTFDKIAKISTEQARKYYNNMIEQGVEKSTISGKSSSLRNMYDYLIANLVEWDGRVYKHILSINPLEGYNIKYKSEQYGTFTENEIKSIISLARKEGRLDLALYYELLVVTAIRSEAVLKLTLSDFMNINGKIYVEGEDKGKQGIEKDYNVQIPQYLYDDLCKLVNDRDERIFKFTRQTALNSLIGAKNRKYENSYCYKIGISKEERDSRNLVLHSFKRASGIMALEYANNIKEVADHMHHANIQTTQIYVSDYDRKETPISMKINLRDNTIEDKKVELEKLSKEELIQIILENGIDF